MEKYGKAFLRTQFARKNITAITFDQIDAQDNQIRGNLGCCGKVKYCTKDIVTNIGVGSFLVRVNV